MILFFDTETTGVNPQLDRLVQLAWIIASETGDVVSRSTMLVCPEGFVIPQGATRIHGITTDMAIRSGVPLKRSLQQLVAAGRDAGLIVAHNLSYDVGILKAEFHRAGMPYPFGITPGICTMRASTAYCGLEKRSGKTGFKWPSLYELHKHIFGYDFVDAHDAGADTEACMKCFFKLVEHRVIANPSTFRTTRVASQKAPSNAPPTTAGRPTRIRANTPLQSSGNRESVLRQVEQKAARKSNDLHSSVAVPPLTTAPESPVHNTARAGTLIIELPDHRRLNRDTSAFSVIQQSSPDDLQEGDAPSGTEEAQLSRLVGYGSWREQLKVAADPATSKDLLTWLWETTIHRDVVANLLANPSCPPEVQRGVMNSDDEVPDFSDLVGLAMNPSCLPELYDPLTKALSDDYYYGDTDPEQRNEVLKALDRRRAEHLGMP